MKSISLGPGALAQPAETGGPNFALSTSEWLALQTFSASALQLPTTIAALSAKLGQGAPADMSDFQPLVAIYARLNAAATTFTQNVYPDVVARAGEIVNYANPLPTYYGALQQLIGQLSGPSSATVQQEIVALVQQLANTAATMQSNAAATRANVGTLVTNMETIAGDFTGPSGVSAYYQNKYGDSSQTLKTVTASLAADQTALSTAEAQYRHDVIVAATTPTYGWCWPFGTIAAAVVAGVYGARATDAKHQIDSLETQVSNLQAQERALVTLIATIQTVETQLTVQQANLTAATLVLETIEGGWSTIQSDLSYLKGMLENNFTSGLQFLEQINYNQVIGEWTTLATVAANYQANAYVTIS